MAKETLQYTIKTHKMKRETKEKTICSEHGKYNKSAGRKKREERERGVAYAKFELAT